jgi:hypothetical protein
MASRPATACGTTTLSVEGGELVVDGDVTPYVVGQTTTCREAVIDPETVLEVLEVFEAVFDVLEPTAVLEVGAVLVEDVEDVEAAWGVAGASLHAARPTASTVTNRAATAILCMGSPLIVATD